MAITSAELNDLFLQVIDEIQTDEFLPEDISGFLNIAQDAIFKRLWNPDHRGEQPGVTGFHESSVKISEYLSPFVQQIGTNNPSGFLPSPFTFTAPSGQEIVRLLSIYLLTGVEGEGGAARWVSWDNIDKILSYPILSPNACKPMYTIRSGGYIAFPAQTFNVALAQALLTPPRIDIANGVGSDFPRSLVNAIVYKACELASISIRDTQFAQAAIAQIKQIGI